MKKLLKRTIIVFSWLFLCSIMLFSTASVTATTEINLAHQKLSQAAENYVKSQLSYSGASADENLSVSAMPLDQRIIIPECPEAFSISASKEALAQNNITVRASCEPTDWYLYMMVKATRVQPVVVLTTSVSPGKVLIESDVEIVMMDKNLIRTSTFADIDTVVGARMKKRSRPGQPVVPGQLCFVCKGDSILITADTGGVSIKTKGIAQQDGNLGDTIAVRNTKSNRLVHAQVVNTHQVVVQI
ncbi:flagellar basal body P-ring formation chaperone FlgA [Aliiglaciecola lipolytica]|uniref:Flagella basal body P-ring formation protein FlgA n=1 Tax=Aliiglaciecola lipolytica E3 TaxID=1127673 RepID=K6XU08_9ALTE|nr:flagellar basal body P-ring formation chaperone FlgA [Aliiglaciecola lipolytica]GAC15171.1 flagella basal body P-ring formation protein FlgA [Aliiglaciecola lipolytica E3]